MKPPVFVGMDPSYNGFAIVMVDKEGEIVDQILLKSKTQDEPEDRIMALEKGFSFVPSIIGLESIYIEGPSFSSKGAFMLQMGALHYYLRIFFRKNNADFKVVTPTELKKYVSGKGTAKKELMLLKTYKKWGIEFEDNNLCDAYGLARMAQEEYNNEQTK